MSNRTMQTSSAEIVVSNDDLLMEILVRLPVKTLSRFKAVSKQWQSVITDRGFVIRRNPNPNPAVGLFVPRQLPVGYAHVSFYDKESTRTRMRFDNQEFSDGFKIIQSCNGLLLCYNFDLKYFVYNPTTGQSSPTIREKRAGTELSLAFDPAKSRHYKVVCVRFLFDHHEYELEYESEIYSSETGSWRMGTRFIVELLSFKKGVYWNGAIHWLDHASGHCLYLNPEDVDGMMMMTPRIPTMMMRMFYFGESSGHLCYVGFCRQCDFVNVFELRTDYSGWYVKYVINLSPVYETLYDLPTGDEGGWEWLWFLAFASTTLVRGEKDEDSFLAVLLSPKVVVKYNFVRGSCETVCDFEDDDGINFAMIEGCFPYIESLCFP